MASDSLHPLQLSFTYYTYSSPSNYMKIYSSLKSVNALCIVSFLIRCKVNPSLFFSFYFSFHSQPKFHCFTSLSSSHTCTIYCVRIFFHINYTRPTPKTGQTGQIHRKSCQIMQYWNSSKRSIQNWALVWKILSRVNICSHLKIKIYAIINYFIVSTYLLFATFIFSYKPCLQK